MPRFQDEYISVLKRVMQPRLPACYFTPEDVDAVQAETPLTKEQIDFWAKNMRFRMPRQEDREAFLLSEKGREKVNPSKVKRYYVSCFNVDSAFIDTFKLRKARSDGEFTIKYLCASLNKEASAGEFFFEFDEYVYEAKLIQCFDQQGAGQVSVVTFQNNDGSESASDALLRVYSQVNNVLYERGVCPPVLKAKLQRKMAGLKFKRRINQGFDLHESDDEGEFDVVKKRRLMDSSRGSPTSDDDPTALARFEEFEADVLPALLEIQNDDNSLRAIEGREFQELFASGRMLPMGGVYFAETGSIDGMIKIGATRRSDPQLRLRELSRYVPLPFTLIAWIPTNNPFTLERVVHRHFAEKRMLAKGACTEFFRLDVASATEYVAMFE